MAPTTDAQPAVLVGGVGQLYQGDLDLGRVVVDRLGREQLGPGVLVEELHYGAVAVAQRLQELRPRALILVGAEPRGRPPGAVERRPVDGLRMSAADVRQAVAEAVTGYVSIDLVVEVCHGLGALPERTVAIEVEPASVDVSPTLSPAVSARLDEVLELVRAELRIREEGGPEMEEDRGVDRGATPDVDTEGTQPPQMPGE